MTEADFKELSKTPSIARALDFLSECDGITCYSSTYTGTGYTLQEIVVALKIAAGV